jgi:hypothetical protein
MGTMKKLWKKLAVFSLLSVLVFSSCGGQVSDQTSNSTDQSTEEKTLTALELPSVEKAEDILNFAAQGADNAAHADGIVLSEDFTATLGSTLLPTYSVPVTYGLHSFAMADVALSEFPLSVEIETTVNFEKVEVLPAMRGVTAEKSGNKIKFTLSTYGDYTLVFDGSYASPFTLFVREYETLDSLGEEYNGYHVIEYQKGIHYVDNIDIADSNTILYLHSGALLIAKQPTTDSETPTLNPDWAGKTRWKSFLTASYVDNVKIMGHGVIDFTNLDWHARSPITVTGCNNFELSGITLINAPEWNVTVQYSKDVYVHDMIIFGYRQNSDGIAICDTENALVEDCFIRSGDDLFEVKSLNKASQTGGKHIIFRNCTAWADKCRGFGIIQETKNDIDDVLYENCAMLFKMATWSEELGSLVVVVGDGGTVSNVTFRDMEVYYDAAYAINVSLGPTDWTEGTETGKILNVTFENIRLGNNNKVRIRKAEQLSESDLSGISFKNITLGESKATFDSLQMTYLYTDLTKNNITIE